MRGLLTAFAFLTRLPLRAGAASDGELGRSVAFFPLVGLALGLVLTGLATMLSAIWPPALVAVLLAALLALMTGALHLDGLADLFDGVAGGGGDRERTLSIMRDSRIGAAGAVALVLVLAAKIVALTALVGARDFLAVLAFPMIGRATVAAQIVLFPYARPEGLGRAFKGEARARELVIATGVTVAILGALRPALLGQAGAALGASLAIAAWMRARLGGLTGDVYGATIEIAETVALFVAAAR